MYGALIPSAAAERWACLAPAGGRDGRHPPANPRRPGVLLDTGTGRTPQLPDPFAHPSAFPSIPAHPSSPARWRLLGGLGSVAVAPRRGLGLCGALPGGSLGGAGGVGARSCPGGHRERECLILPTNCSSAELSPI